jgi:hypothetical protein
MSSILHGIMYGIGVLILYAAIDMFRRRKPEPETVGLTFAEWMVKAYSETLENAVDAHWRGDEDEKRYWMRLLNEREKALRYVLAGTDIKRLREAEERATVPLWPCGECYSDVTGKKEKE